MPFLNPCQLQKQKVRKKEGGEDALVVALARRGTSLISRTGVAAPDDEREDTRKGGSFGQGSRVPCDGGRRRRRSNERLRRAV